MWEDFTPGDFDIFYRRSVDDGTTFPNIIKNLSNSGNSRAPAIADIGNSVHVVWFKVTFFADSDIMHRRSLDGGTTFPNVIKNLSDNFGISSFPAIAMSGSNVYVVWEDLASLATKEVLYRTSADNGATFPAIISNLSADPGESENPSIAYHNSQGTPMTILIYFRINSLPFQHDGDRYYKNYLAIRLPYPVDSR